MRLWTQYGVDGRPLQRCTIAHFLADTEQSVAQELEWDLLALEAATGCADSKDRDAVDEAVASFLPSLHLNVGDAYRRSGERDFALQHAVNGIARIGSLPEGGYGDIVRSGLTRLRPEYTSELLL
jgi:hypothetical protein